MMEERCPSPAGRLSHRSGFALLELLVAVCVLAVLTSLSVIFVRFSSVAYYLFPSQYTRIKSESLLTGQRHEYEDDTETSYPAIYFKENGTVNQARTLSFVCGTNIREIVIELGPGALVFRR